MVDTAGIVLVPYRFVFFNFMLTKEKGLSILVIVMVKSGSALAAKKAKKTTQSTVWWFG